MRDVAAAVRRTLLPSSMVFETESSFRKASYARAVTQYAYVPHSPLSVGTDWNRHSGLSVRCSALMWPSVWR